MEHVVYRLVVCEGTILDTPEYPAVPMPYFHFAPTAGIRPSMDHWIEAGGTHHQALVLGHHARRWTMLCRMLKIECVTV